MQQTVFFEDHLDFFFNFLKSYYYFLETLELNAHIIDQNKDDHMLKRGINILFWTYINSRNIEWLKSPHPRLEDM